MIIRPLTEDDLKACASLYAQVFTLAPWNEPWTTESALQRLNHFFHSRGFAGFVARQNNITGFVMGNREPFHSGQLFYLREFCVDRGKQSTGCGSQLLEALQSELVLHEVRAMYLTTEREINAAAFYQKRGFKYSESMGFYAKALVTPEELKQV